jgi:hypothetical protein
VADRGTVSRVAKAVAFAATRMGRKCKMGKFIIGLVAAAVIGGYVGRVALAEETKCEGTITKIEGEKVTVKTPTNSEQHMWVVPATKVMLDGKASKTTDLKVGQHVKCTCSKQGDKMTCNMIEASSRAQ